MNFSLSKAQAAALFAALPLACLSASCDGRFVTSGESADERPLPEVQLHGITYGETAPSPDYDATLFVSFWGMPVCTATLITPTAALTAAHCVHLDCDYDENGEEVACRPVTDASLFSLGAGTSTGSHSLGLRAVTKVHFHEDYDHERILNDIALLEFSKPFQGIEPVPLLPSREGLAWSAEDTGMPVTYSGYGRTETGASGSRLRVNATADIICLSGAGCSDYAAQRYVPPNTVCSLMARGGTCSGDSGGPLFLTKKGVTYVGGATSFGDEDCSEFGCSTNVSAYADWIAEQLGGGKGQGEGCADDSQCLSGFCAEGVCCDSRCDATLCESCRKARGAAADGVCTPIVQCDGESDCSEAGTCDPNSGTCTYAPKPAATLCDDGSACTLDDHCLLGKCVGSGSVWCPPPGECQAAPASGETCDPDSGACLYDPLPDGTACEGGTCRGGTCKRSSSGGCSAAPADGGPAFFWLLSSALALAHRLRRRR